MNKVFYFSASELYHHGIKGQKWGVRRFQNEDGSLTEAGQKRYYKAWKKQYESDPQAYLKMPKDTDGMDSIKRLNNNLAESLNEYNKISKEIESAVSDYRKNREYWSAVSGAASGLLFNDTRMDDIARRINLSVYDDLDQGYMNSAAIWAKETGKAKTLNQLTRKEADAYKQVETNVKNEVNDILGKYGDKKISGHATAASTMVNSILNSTQAGSAAYIIDDISQGPRTESDNKAVKTAKEIVGKLSLGTGNNKAYYLLDAVENCGLKNTDFRDMTDSDWKKLSIELSRISK